MLHQLASSSALPRRFLDEAPAASQNLPHFEPATFYEAAAPPGHSSYMPPTVPDHPAPPQSIQGVELTSSPAPKNGV